MSKSRFEALLLSTLVTGLILSSFVGKEGAAFSSMSNSIWSKRVVLYSYSASFVGDTSSLVGDRFSSI